ncbi:hypothetical protein [Fulvimarina endophytica]|nr:hypothetical protein [Fulvimarina endophytica]
MSRHHPGIVTLACAAALLASAVSAGAHASDAFAHFELRLGLEAGAGAGAASALALALPFGLPPLEARTILRALHLLGLCAGLGSVIVLDVLLARAVLRGRFEMRNANMLVILARVTGAGLLALWVSGLGFLALYWFDQPALLDNPKILAKVVIVAVLTINGILLHAYCLPRFEERLSEEPLLSMPAGLRTSMIAVATISAVSWYAAFGLGLAREFNGRVPAQTLLSLWALSTMAAFLLAWLAMAVLERHRRRGRKGPGRGPGPGPGPRIAPSA